MEDTLPASRVLSSQIPGYDGGEVDINETVEVMFPINVRKCLQLTCNACTIVAMRWFICIHLYSTYHYMQIKYMDWQVFMVESGPIALYTMASRNHFLKYPSSLFIGESPEPYSHIRKGETVSLCLL